MANARKWLRLDLSPLTPGERPRWIVVFSVYVVLVVVVFSVHAETSGVRRLHKVEVLAAQPVPMPERLLTIQDFLPYVTPSPPPIVAPQQAYETVTQQDGTLTWTLYRPVTSEELEHRREERRKRGFFAETSSAAPLHCREMVKVPRVWPGGVRLNRVGQELHAWTGSGFNDQSKGVVVQLGTTDALICLVGLR